MTRALLAARHVLVVAPHPDDEAIGAWALMRTFVRRGARIDLVVVTDGAASHPGSRSWPAPRLVAERQRETLRAMAALTVPPSRVRFLALPDGSLGANGAEHRRIIARAVRRRVRPDLIVGPVPDDAHADHRAVALALAEVRRRGERRLGYRVWPEAGRRVGAQIGVRLNGRELASKRRVVRSYRTQSGKITDAQAGFTITARHLNAFVRPMEWFELLA